MSRALRAAVVLLVGPVVLVGACSRGDAASLPAGRLSFLTDSGTVTIAVEIAETGVDRVQGLRGRAELAADAGMVFLHEGPTGAAFTMEDTLIPLSVAFWDGAGHIVAMLDMDPCRSDPCPTYAPGVLYVGAVEVNQGLFEDRGIEMGDQVELER